MGLARVAALFVETGGVYFNQPGVDPWDEPRDARRYTGPWPVVAHPPCQRWGRMAYTNQARRRQMVGEDQGCFASALMAVRNYGGVLEHPAASAAWRAFGLAKPPHHGGWVKADELGGWTCCLAQRNYGHAATKATWLYAVKVELPRLTWGGGTATYSADRLPHGPSSPHSKPEASRRLGRVGDATPVPRSAAGHRAQRSRLGSGLA